MLNAQCISGESFNVCRCGVEPFFCLPNRGERQFNRVYPARDAVHRFDFVKTAGCCVKSRLFLRVADEFALPLRRPSVKNMKKLHIVLLLLVVAGIVGMSFFIKDLTTQETFKTAQGKKDKYVVIKAKLDKATPIEYDAIKNPNLTVFYALDNDGQRQKVVYSNAKITDMERSEGLDLNGYMRNGYFECNKIQTKCPSKYKDDMNAAQKNLPTGTSQY